MELHVPSQKKRILRRGSEDLFRISRRFFSIPFNSLNVGTLPPTTTSATTSAVELAAVFIDINRDLMILSTLSLWDTFSKTGR
jgi:hypothetical protein